jgi:dihydroorotate dehydrogenase
VYRTLRDLLFLLPPETSHHAALLGLRLGERMGISQQLVHGIYQPVTAMGLKFRNRVGLAAGLDKDARCIEGLLAMGFGFIEVGTLTPRPQPGNPRPRMFRLIEDEALINRMGFNNGGVAAAVERVRAARLRLGPTAGLIGVNIGKNKDTDNANAAEDYLAGLDIAYDVADYVTINISSPNTTGLRELQERAALQALLTTLKRRRDELRAERARDVPLAAKIAPDLDGNAVAAVADVLLDVGIDACIATNTTISRPLPQTTRRRDEAGGLSGIPLHALAVQCVERLATALGGRIPIIGVGGIHDVASARRFIDAGATLVQVYTGFIYRGPALVRDLARALGGR